MNDRTGPRKFTTSPRKGTQVLTVELMKTGASDLEVRGFLLARGMQKDSAVVMLSRARIECGRAPDSSIRGRPKKPGEARRPDTEEIDGRRWIDEERLREVSDRFVAALRESEHPPANVTLRESMVPRRIAGAEVAAGLR